MERKIHPSKPLEKKWKEKALSRPVHSMWKTGLWKDTEKWKNINIMVTEENLCKSSKL